ncbi:MAG TPA: LUD domain-containing protein [Candidatus Angelobacter sp.]|nr:LUD domain-containing protein [Candidatus Angelobacter sp.]
MSAANNPGRTAILDRIRAALRNPAPEPAAAPASGEAIFEPVVNPIERFQTEAKANLMECSVTADAQASSQQLTQVLDSLPPGEIFVEDHPSLRHLIELSKTSRSVRWSSEGAPREVSQASVTRVEALVAQTGSLFVSAACGGRGASVVAPCHIAFATTSQLVPDLATALKNASHRGTLENNSFACMISGSSRTADIEKILVQGAHGPRRLVVILEKNS